MNDATSTYVAWMTTSRPATWIDHIVLAVSDVDAAERWIEQEWGVRATVGGSHDGRGTRNVLLSLSERTYLEVIGPDRGQPDPPHPRPFGVDELDSGPRGRLAGWAVGTSDIDALVAELRAEGVDPGDVESMARTRPDGVRLQWRLTLGRSSARPAVPFLIDWGETPSPAVDSARGVTLSDMVIETGPAGDLSTLLGVSRVGVRISDSEIETCRVVLRTPGGEVILQS